MAAGNEATAANRRAAEMMVLSWRALAAALLTLPVFVLEMGGHVVPAFHQMIHEHIDRETNWFVQFLLTTLVLARPGPTVLSSRRVFRPCSGAVQR